MTPLERDVARTLEDAGMAPAEIEGRRQLFAATAEVFGRAYGREPAIAWWAPGRIEIFGKHTDYAGGRSLVAAAPRGFAMLASPRSDSRLRVCDARWRVEDDIDLADASRAYTGWVNYVAVVARRLQTDFPGAALGCDIAFASDVPRASGVSSSSALVVGLASVLIDRGGLRARPEWAANLPSMLDLAGYLGAVENGLGFGRFPATAGVGTHGGSEDHTAILNCRGDRVSAFSYVPVREAGAAPMPDPWRFVVMTSGVEASKAGAVKDRYNALSLMTRRLADLCQAEGGARDSDGNRASLGALLRADTQAASRLERAILESAGEDERDALIVRLRHFVAEDARVPEALAAFSAGNTRALGEISAASQEDAGRLLRNQIPETVELAAAARRAGAFAASSFGAGFGGSVWALVAGGETAAFVARWRDTFLRAHPDRTSASGFVARPSPGATRIR